MLNGYSVAYFSHPIFILILTEISGGGQGKYGRAGNLSDIVKDSVAFLVAYPL